MMSQRNSQAIATFKKIVDDLNIDYEKIYLFGSRAKGLETENSDYDFCIVVKKSLAKKEKKILRGKARILFHDIFPMFPIDIIVYEAHLFTAEKNNIHSLSYEIHRNGILL